MTVHEVAHAVGDAGQLLYNRPASSEASFPVKYIIVLRSSIFLIFHRKLPVELSPTQYGLTFIDHTAPRIL